MNFYVPEIGDNIKLLKDWEFDLHAERRNEALGAFFNHYLARYSKWLDNNDLAPMRLPDYTVEYPDRDAYTKFFGKYDYEGYNKACNDACNNNEDYVRYQKDLDTWNSIADGLVKDAIKVVIPAGTVLKIDRIYIKKGATEYSSITFYAKDLGEVILTNRYNKKKAEVIKVLG
jgi:hypothetical protein